MTLLVQFRRRNPTVLKRDHMLFGEVEGAGALIGGVIGVRPLRGGWWGEGEVKLHLDGDEKSPMIGGAGVEDCFWAVWGMACYQKPWRGCTLGG